MNAPTQSSDPTEPAPTLIALDGEQVTAPEPASASQAPETMDSVLEAELKAELAAATADSAPAEPTPETAPTAIREEPVPGQASPDETEFAGLVRDAIGRFDGQILFELDHDPAYGHVAAVQMGDGEERQFAMVIKPDDGGPLRVEPAAESEHPLAAIMQSYAGLVDAWKKAA